MALSFTACSISKLLLSSGLAGLRSGTLTRCRHPHRLLKPDSHHRGLWHPSLSCLCYSTKDRSYFQRSHASTGWMPSRWEVEARPSCPPGSYKTLRCLALFIAFCRLELFTVLLFDSRSPSRTQTACPLTALSSCWWPLSPVSSSRCLLSPLRATFSCHLRASTNCVSYFSPIIWHYRGTFRALVRGRIRVRRDLCSLIPSIPKADKP